MSQNTQQAALPKCPGCEEPLEPGDRFCGACGYDLSVIPARPQDEPTIALNGPLPPGASSGPALPRPAQAPPAAPAWPSHVPGAHPDASPPAGTPEDSPAETPAGDTAVPPRSAPAVPPPPAAPPAPPQGAASSDRAQKTAAPPPPATPPTPQAGVRLRRRSEPAAPSSPAGAPNRRTGGVPRPARPGAQPRQAPDPRVAAGQAQQAADARVVCVACRAGRVDDDGYCEHCGHAQPRERDHMEQECGPLAAVSDRGLRHHRNEDAFGVGTLTLPDGSPACVAIVCDGVSSSTRPDEASLAASRTANASLLAALPRGTHPQQAMHDAIVAASEAVDALADASDRPAREPGRNAPACTIVGAVVTQGLLVVGWVGDSRAYWVPANRSAPAARLTEDDSWAAQMVAAGLMGEAEAYADHRAHAITGWLGADACDVEPHTAAFKPDRPGTVVVCTDGLWNYAESADDMARIVPADAAERPLHSARVLVGHALDGGGHDNVTVALVPFPPDPQGAGSA